MKAFKTYPLIIVFTLLTCSLFAQKGKSDNNINQMISLYFDMKNALVNNDGTTVKIKANKLYHILATDPGKGLDRDQMLFLADHLEDLMNNCQQMCYTIDRIEQRPYFARLTKTLYYLVKGLKINTTTIYMHYSPANNAYWMSETMAIKNPYNPYKEWSTDGKTTEILAANK